MEEKNSRNSKKGEKVTKFASKLSQLRKERGISQKKASEDLGISQALLSHYEKGIRECGLDFVVRCSEYYGVTTDYLLGASESRNGLDIDGLVDDGELSVTTLLQATKYMLNLLPTGNDESVLRYVYDYYILSIYRCATTMAKTGSLPKELFKIDYSLGRELASAAIAMEDAKFVFIEDKSRTGTDLSKRTVLHSVIEKAEELILKTFTPEGLE
ncbi:MAG: helix-turn-helix domain-containing protein [Clostridiales bacterium]|nr:helix-turn-helix domain-containing protein [Clostridiales bacterium]